MTSWARFPSKNRQLKTHSIFLVAIFTPIPCLAYQPNTITRKIPLKAKYGVHFMYPKLECSEKFSNNLSVEAGGFYHFRELILCNAKCLQFNRNKKKERRGTVQKLFYSPMLPFKKMDVVVGSVGSAQKKCHCDGSIVIFMDAD